MARSATLVPASAACGLALLLAAGCAPQSAVLTDGQYWAFLSDGTSFSLSKGTVDPTQFENNWNIDCRDLTERERAAIGLEEPLTDVCSSTPGLVDVRHESWLSQSAWHVVNERIDPWRGEAIITSEGDFQVGFHHRLPGGSDFRFSFAVDPDFQPTRCEVDESGEIEAVAIDGDWLENWTADLHALDPDNLEPGYEILADYIGDQDATLYYLNARSVQFNPSKTTETWSIPLEWRAGFAAGKFADEDFHSRASRAGEPALYNFFEQWGQAREANPNDLFFCSLQAGADPSESSCIEGKIDRALQIVDDTARELALVGVSKELVDGARGQGGPIYRPMVHDNLWRTPDGFPGGLDAWVEYHYNYVVIKGEVAKGNSVEGAFSLVFDGDDSNSRWLVQGKFEVPRIKEDNWTTIDIREQKHEENGTVRCSY